QYYTGLGLRAARGRTIVADDDRLGADPVAVITDEYWERRFSRDPSVIGKRLSVNGIATTIIGVTPPAFAGTQDIGKSPDLSLPMTSLIGIRRSPEDLTNGSFFWVHIMGRRAPGVSETQARA